MSTLVEQARFLERDVASALPDGALLGRLQAAAREGRPLRVKLGLDPTAPDLHLGHTVVLGKLREFQDLGHRVVLIVGDFTARVGDPSGRSATRPALSAEQIEANAATYRTQAFRVLREDPDLLEIRRNSEWLDMAMAELFALARTTTVAQLLERHDFARRLGAGSPISILELLYPLLQGYDSVAIAADVELGGTDQTFNLMLGRDIQRAYGVAQQCVLTTPILPGLDGVEKMSKSLGNHVGVTEDPDSMYGRILSLPDASMADWFAMLGVAEPPGGTSPRDRKHALADALVTRFHGRAAARRARERFEVVFVAHAVPEDAPDVTLEPSTDGLVHLPALIATAFGRSRGEARRLLGQGGVRLDGQVLDAEPLDRGTEELAGRVLQVGRRSFARLVDPRA